MDVVSVATIQSMGLDVSSLVPVQARVFGPSRGAEIKMKGGILLRVGLSVGAGPNTVRLFYVAESVSHTYLSLATLKALGIVEPDYPCIQTRLDQTRRPLGHTTPRMTVTQGTRKSLGKSGTQYSSKTGSSVSADSVAGISAQQVPPGPTPQDVSQLQDHGGSSHPYVTVTQGTFQSCHSSQRPLWICWI